MAAMCGVHRHACDARGDPRDALRTRLRRTRPARHRLHRDGSSFGEEPAHDRAREDHDQRVRTRISCWGAARSPLARRCRGGSPNLRTPPRQPLRRPGRPGGRDLVRRVRRSALRGRAGGDLASARA